MKTVWVQILIATHEKYLFRSLYTKNSTSFDLSNFFIQAAGLVYHRRTTCGVYHQGRQAALVSHQPLGAGSSCGLMICNSYGFGDMHAFGVILRLSSNPNGNPQKISFPISRRLTLRAKRRKIKFTFAARRFCRGGYQPPAFFREEQAPPLPRY